MPRLHDPARHEPLTTTRWSEHAAREAVTRIATDALHTFSPSALWCAHPLDDPDTPERRHAMLYFGAGGVIWALEHLRRVGAIGGDFDFRDTVATLVGRNRELIDTWEDARGSYLMGDTGLRLLQWQMAPDASLADALFDGIEANLRHKTLEALWGSPGSLLASLHMAEATGQARWRDQLERGLRVLFDAMVFDEALGIWLWVQDMYGKHTRYLGGGHGFVGNVFPALRAAALLPAALVEAFVERALQTLKATAVHDGAVINWEPLHDPSGNVPSKLLVQDCHGAPGIVCRLAAAPRTPQWDALLLGAGEATWLAGPLVKGSGLCHGTAGNGYALLALWQRSGDPLWLERARAFAMHAIEQVDRFANATGQTRHSLWTGDIGVALFAWACIDGDARFPTLDVF
ncbi:MAG: LanC-like protein [Burkholderiaceae bacterium]